MDTKLVQFPVRTYTTVVCPNQLSERHRNPGLSLRVRSMTTALEFAEGFFSKTDALIARGTVCLVPEERWSIAGAIGELRTPLVEYKVDAIQEMEGDSLACTIAPI